MPGRRPRRKIQIYNNSLVIENHSVRSLSAVAVASRLSEDRLTLTAGAEVIGAGEISRQGIPQLGVLHEGRIQLKLAIVSLYKNIIILLFYDNILIL